MVKWDDKINLDSIKYKKIILDLYNLKPESKQGVILIVVNTKEIPLKSTDGLDIKLLRKFENSVVSSENYYLYLFKKIINK